MASQAKRLKLEDENDMSVFEFSLKQDIKKEPQGDVITPESPTSMAGSSSSNFTLHKYIDQDVENVSVLKHLALTSTIFVSALETIRSLRKKCAQMGIKGNFYFEKPTKEAKLTPKIAKLSGQYVVERILDYNTTMYLYLIKWKGWNLEYNTWEPIDHLSGCEHLVENFRFMLKSLSDTNKTAYKNLILLNCMIEELTSRDSQDPLLLLKLNGKTASDYKSEDLWPLKIVLKRNFTFEDNQNQPNLKYNRILDKAMKDLNILKHFESFNNFVEFFDTRKNIFKSLKNWEAKINHSLPKEDGFVSIKVENNVDLDLPPEEFNYITKCIPGTPDVHIQDEPLWFCCCEDDCSSNQKLCSSKPIAYKKNGSLKDFHTPTIFECNSKCKCPPTCANRVIQKGVSKFKLAIFKTDNGRGWGVKALENIPKGKFVAEYVGEIVTYEEAERRSVLGPFYGTYLFNIDYDLDFNCEYIIDAGKYGNISRFINHSCSPNLEVFMFWVDNPDMPRVAFFSQKMINKGEELSINYRMTVAGMDDTTEEDKFNPGVIKMPCKCMSRNCKKFL